MSGKRYLSIVSDDFGLYPAMNEGIAQGFEQGVLTDTNLMAPCPGYNEALAIWRRIGMPVGLHVTFTCEKSGPNRWGPLSRGRSLMTDDGGFPRHPEETWAQADYEEALVEARAQFDALVADGIPVTHIRQHRDPDDGGRVLRAAGALAREKNVPYIEQMPDLPPGTPHYRWESRFCLSPFSTEFRERKTRLRQILWDLRPGYHLWTVHASSAKPSPEDEARPRGQFDIWKTYCAIDQQLVLDSQVREWLDALEIERVPLTRCSVASAC